MSRAVVLLAGVCLIVLLGGNSVAGAEPQGDRLRLGLLFGYEAASHDDLDDTIAGAKTRFDAVIDSLEGLPGSLDTYDFSSDHMTGGMVLGVRVEYALTQNLLIGAEASRLSGTGAYTNDYQHRDQFAIEEWSGATDYDVTGILVMARGIYLIRTPQLPVNFRVGAGAGMIRGHLDIASSGFYQYDLSRYREPWSDGLEATGYGAAFDGFAGVELPVSDRYVFTGDVGYRFASVSKLKVDKVDDLSGVQKDETLLWDDLRFSTENGKEVGLNFSGIYVTIGVAMTF